MRTGGAPAGIADGAPLSAPGPWLGRAAPNPFTRSTELAFMAPHDATVHLGVFDVQGRLLAKLAEGEQDAGRHRVRWAGRDAGGSLVPPGVYYIRLVCGGQVEAQKIVLSR